VPFSLIIEKKCPGRKGVLAFSLLVMKLREGFLKKYKKMSLY